MAVTGPEKFQMNRRGTVKSFGRFTGGETRWVDQKREEGVHTPRCGGGSVQRGEQGGVCLTLEGLLDDQRRRGRRGPSSGSRLRP